MGFASNSPNFSRKNRPFPKIMSNLLTNWKLRIILQFMNNLFTNFKVVIYL